VRLQLNVARLAFILALIALAIGSARADEVIVRGNYWRDRNTRVLQPAAELTKELPTGTLVGVHYLLDAITSASVAAGVQSDQPFTELRNEFGVTLGQRFGPAAIAASYTYSSESDYTAHTVSLGGQVDLGQRNTSLAATLAYGTDTVYQRMGPTVFSRQGGLDSVRLLIGVTQLLSPTAMVSLNYDLAVVGFGSKDNGFQANPYRTVLLGGSPSRESVPFQRYRNAFSLTLRWIWPTTSALVPYFALRPSYRYYFDDWDVSSHSIELRSYLPVGPVEFRVTGRYYTQGEASFWRDQFGLPMYVNTPGDSMGSSGAFCTNCNSGSAKGMRFFTADPKLSSFSNVYVEVQIQLKLRFLQRVSQWLSQGTFDLSYGHMFEGGYAHTAFGDAEIAGTTFIFPL
jgi:hypothetical protein